MGPFLVICGGNIAWIGVDVSLVLAPDEARLQTYQAEKSTSLVDMDRVSRLDGQVEAVQTTRSCQGELHYAGLG